MSLIANKSSQATVTPSLRLRRLRSNATLRSMVRESHIRIEKLIYPLFVMEGKGLIKEPVNSMPGVYQMSLEETLKEVESIANLGLSAVLLFGLPATKDGEGSGSWLEDGIIQKTIRAIKSRFPQLMVIADTCLCEYTDHGHCGIVANGKILNDPTLTVLCKSAVAQARAGADIIAPSDMMDGRVAAIRHSLNTAGFEHVPIMAYSAKFASALYSPFRDAAECAPQFGDRTTYQMDPANAREALREIELDISEGADIVMVKPALPYLDIISQARELTRLPIAAYDVSGEYSMVKAASANGWIDERRVTLELITSIFRAGTDLVITYHAKDIARWLS